MKSASGRKICGRIIRGPDVDTLDIDIYEHWLQ